MVKNESRAGIDPPEPADDEPLGQLCHNLVHDQDLYASFLANPIGTLKERSVEIDAAFADRAQDGSLATFLALGGDPLSRLPPGQLDVPAAHVCQQSQEPPIVVPVAIVAVAIASTPAVFSSDASAMVDDDSKAKDVKDGTDAE